MVIHFRSVSRLTGNPSFAKCSAASVGPKSAYGLANPRQNLLLEESSELAV